MMMMMMTTTVWKIWGVCNSKSHGHISE